MEVNAAGAVAEVVVATMIAMTRRRMMMAAKAVGAVAEAVEAMTIAMTRLRMTMAAKVAGAAMKTADLVAIMDLKDRRNRRVPISARKKSVT